MKTDCPLIPTESKLVIQRKTAEETTPGGIVIPDTAKEKPRVGRILEVGPEKRTDQTCEDRAPLFKAGQHVYFSAYAGNEVEIEGHKLLILNFEDVLAIVRE